MKYYITEMGNLPKEFFKIKHPIMVKVIPEDFVYYYHNNREDDDYNDILAENEKWLIFENYMGKERWLINKKEECDDGIYWEIDFEDFIPHTMAVNEFATGKSFIRTMYEVILVYANTDVIQAKEYEMEFKVKTGSQYLLESLELKTIGEDKNKYFVIKWDEDNNKIYAISSSSPERDEAGHFFVDRLYYLKQSYLNGRLDIVKIDKKAGIYNYLTKQFFRFQ